MQERPVFSSSGFRGSRFRARFRDSGSSSRAFGALAIKRTQRRDGGRKWSSSIEWNEPGFRAAVAGDIAGRDSDNGMLQPVRFVGFLSRTSGNL